MNEELIELEEEIEETVIDVEESIGWAVGDSSRHDSLTGRNDENQHEIKAIEGLGDELKQIKMLQEQYSDKLGTANYYLWDDKQTRDDYGYFVSLASADTIKICNGNADDIFGVTVNEAGFIGGQSELVVDETDGSSTHTYTRDKSYALVVTTGHAKVRCVGDISVGDCVIASEDGTARKTKTSHGYKVIAIHDNIKNDGSIYASIMLGVQADVTDKISAVVTDLDERLDATEAQALMAINIAQRAMDAAENGGGSGGGDGDISSDRLDEIENSITDVNTRLDDVSDIAESASMVSAEAKSIANNAIKFADSVKDEAVGAANNALVATNELRNDFNDQANRVTNSINSIEGNLEELERWKGDTSETLVGLAHEVTENSATVATIASYTGGVVSGAVGLIAQVEANKASIDMLARLEGEDYSGLASLTGQVTENAAQVSLLSKRVTGKYTVIDSWDEASKDHDTIYHIKAKTKDEDGLYYYYSNDSWKNTTDAYTAGLPTAIGGIQVITDDHSSTINNLVSWQGKTNTSMANIEQKADENGAYIHSIVANIDKYAVGTHSQAYGFTLEQAASVLEEGTIYAPTEYDILEEYPLVNNAIEWIDGEKDNEKVYYKETTSDEGQIIKTYYYTQYDLETKTYTWTESSEFPKYRREFDKENLYYWGRLGGDGPYGWTNVDREYSESKLNTSNPSVFFVEAAPPSNNTTHGYWYKTDDLVDENGEVLEKEYEPHTLYKCELAFTREVDGKEEKEYQWVAVATLTGNLNSRAISQIRQDTNQIVAEVTNAYGAVAGFGAKLSDTDAKVHSIASWPGDNKDTHHMAIFEQKVGEDGSPYMVLATARNVEGEDETSEIKELKGAKIILSDTDDESFIQLDADKINFDTKAFTIRDTGAEGEEKPVLLSAGNGQATIGGFTVTGKSITNDKVSFDDDENDGVYLGTDGIGLGKGAFYVDKTGYLHSTEGEIAGWKIEENQLHKSNTSNTFDVRLSAPTELDDGDGTFKEGCDVLAVINKTDSDNIKWPFYLRSSGYLHCANIHATGGQIGGWDLSETKLINQFQLENPIIENGITKNYRVFGMQTKPADGSTINAIAIGNINKTSGWSDAAFRVTHDGILYARAANISGDSVFNGTVYATDGEFRGTLYVTKGEIGGLLIHENAITTGENGLAFSKTGDIVAKQLDTTILCSPQIKVGTISGRYNNSCLSLEESEPIYEIATVKGFNTLIEEGVLNGDVIKKPGSVTFGYKSDKKLVENFTRAFNVVYEDEDGTLHIYPYTLTIPSGKDKVSMTVPYYQYVSHPSNKNIAIIAHYRGDYFKDISISQPSASNIEAISCTGFFTPADTETYNLGTKDKVWKELYAKTAFIEKGYVGNTYTTTGSIITSDVNKKNSIQDIDEKYSKLFDQLRPVTFKLNEGTSGRTHIGLIAQEVKSSADLLGIDSQDLATYCSWKDNQDNETCGIRYEELIGLCIYEIQKLKKRVEELENKLNTQQND